MIYDSRNEIEVNKAKVRFENLIKKQSKFELKEIKIKSVKLNSYLHVCISIYAIEFGYTLDEAKTHLKRSCDFMIYEKNGDLFLRRTRDLNNEERSSFVEWIRNYSSNEGLYIPDAEEYKQNRFEIDKEISKFKSYL